MGSSMNETMARFMATVHVHTHAQTVICHMTHDIIVVVHGLVHGLARGNSNQCKLLKRSRVIWLLKYVSL